MNELNHGADKGDKDRSPGWRKNYDGIRWSGVVGFKRRDSRLRKIYRTITPNVITFPEKHDSPLHENKN